MKSAIRTILTVMVLFFFGTIHAQSGYYTVTASELNVRSGPGTQYSKVIQLHKGETVIVKRMYDSDWAEITVASKTCYISRKHITYKGPVPEQETVSKQKSKINRKTGGFWDFMYEIVKGIIFLCVIVVFVGGALDKDWGGYAMLLLMACGIGALISGFVFHNSRAGAVVGMFVGILFLARNVLIDFDTSEIGWFTYLVWYLISLPFYILDLLQFWLAKPWRPLMKRNNLPDRAKPGMRTFLRILQVPFYIALFPLRFINAVYYNIIIHNVYELSNYILEVAAPSDYDEGRKNIWMYLLLLPYRFLKYVLWHGAITFIESIIWTVIDTFIPAVTLYHGTEQLCADNMLCDPKRNKQRKNSTGWLTGIWNVGGGNYAGDGIYFGIFRKTLRNYQRGSAIVARVSTGKTIDVILMPDSVYYQAGYPNAKAVSNWGLNNGYVSGEWWRSDRNTNWWEICMYDRQNRYNDSWRIRPIYAIRSRDGIMQRIPGGTAHWLFRDMVLSDLWNSIKNIIN